MVAPPVDVLSVTSTLLGKVPPFGDSAGVATVGVPPPPRGLSVGPSAVGTKLALDVSSSLSRRKPSSRIHTLIVCSPIVSTLTLATTPSSVLLRQVAVGVKPGMRSPEATPTPSIPTCTESSPVVSPTPRTHT